MLLFIFGLVVIILILLFVLSKIIVSIQYTYEQNNQHVTLSVFILRIRCFKKKYDLAEWSKQKFEMEAIHFESFSERIKTSYKIWKDANKRITEVLQKVSLHHYSWVTVGGTGDAFSTGIASGGIWTIKGIITGFFLEKVQLKCKPNIQVEPHFQQRYLRTDFDCMVSIRIGQAIHALIKLIRKPIKLQHEEANHDRRTSN
ncbi:DUF2953 domain-containing protein [Oceanobacillus sp. CF4.6]|uniref:DUF2953 domain-containing protein n=1 Tax=Oceanobacillus sp. CF4.6 TaxID=3373080 RepID=UPI003EE7F424